MRSAILPAPVKPLELVEREVPEPGPGEILVKVTACGMCYSEVNHLRGHYPFGTFPVVPGHEISGVVAALGEGVVRPEVGTPVGAAWPYGSCGHCDQCARGDQILCTGAPGPSPASTATAATPSTSWAAPGSSPRCPTGSTPWPAPR